MDTARTRISGNSTSLMATPVTASTADALQAAINELAGVESGTITLGSAITANIEIKSDNRSNITLDLNGKTLQDKGGNAGFYTIIHNGTGTLTITDTSEGKAGKVSSTSMNFNTIKNASTGNVTIKAGTVSSKLIAIANESTGIVTVEGGTVSATVSVAIKNTGAGTVNITAGTIVATSGGYAINNNSTGTIIVEGGTVSATGVYANAINNKTTGTIKVTGGTVSSTGANAINNNSTGTIKVTGGNIKSIAKGSGKLTNDGDVNVYLATFTEPTGGTNQTFTITNPAGYSLTNSTHIGNKYYVWLPVGEATATYNGGNYVATVAAYGVGVFYKEGTELVTVVDNSAKLNTAISNSTGEATIKLMPDGAGFSNTAITIATAKTNNISIDLNGQTLTHAGNTITHNGTGTLTITNSATSGGGAVTCSGNSSNAILNNGTGKVTITAGTVSATGTNAINNNSTGTIKVTGGNIKSIAKGSGTLNNGESAVYLATFTEPTGGTNKIFAITNPAGYSLTNSTHIGNKYYVWLPVGEAKATYNNVEYIAYVNSDNSGAFLKGSDLNNIEVDNSAQLNTAISSSTREATIKLMPGGAGFSNIAITIATAKTNNITIDLNGQTLTHTGNTITHNGTGTLTITNSATSGDGAVTCSGDNRSAILNNGAGKVTITAGTVSSVGYAINNDSTGTITVTGGIVCSTGENAPAIYNYSTGTITVTGGTVSSTGANAPAINNNSTGTITVTGGTVSSTGANAIYNYFTSEGTITVTGGNIKSIEKSSGTLKNDGNANVYLATFTEPTDSMNKTFAITNPAGYSLTNSTHIGNKYYVWLPEGLTTAKYDDDDYYTTVLATGKAVFTKGTPPLVGSIAITGDVKYGSTLTAIPTISSTDTGILAYKWKKDNEVINGATASTYKLTAADVGAQITCEVSAAKYGDSFLTSADTAAVAAIQVTVTITCEGKAYDGANTVGNAMYTVNGIIGKDNVSASGTATYTDVNAGTGKTINVTGIILGGTDKDNYTLTATTATTTASIARKAITPAISNIAGVTYTGSELKPTFTVSDSLIADTDYTVKYANNINAGTNTGEITITTVTSSNYSFTAVTAKFTITKATRTNESVNKTVSTVGKRTSVTLPAPATGSAYSTPSANGTITATVMTISGNNLSFTVDGSSLGDKGTITIPVTGTNYESYNIVISITSGEVKNKVTILGGVKGSQIGNTSQTVVIDVAEGATVNINAGIQDLYTFKGWISNDNVIFTNITNAATTFVMPDKDVTVTATWNIDHATIVAPVPNEHIDVTKPLVISFKGEYDTRTEITLNANVLTQTPKSATETVLSGYPGYDGNIGTAKSGSVIIEYTPAFLAFLPYGTYTQVVSFTEYGVVTQGTASFKKEAEPETTPASAAAPAPTKSNPKTSVDAMQGSISYTLWIFALIAFTLSIAAIMTVALYKKVGKRNK